MSKSKIGVVGLGLVGLGSTLFASPAQAAMSCGTAPTGGTLVAGGDYCQLTFSTNGSYNVTVPSSATELYAILVGSGSGAVTSPGNTGYSGTGGHVKYVNLTDQIGSDLTFNVGTGGAASTTSTATSPGVDTVVIYPGGGNSAWTGNYDVTTSDFCTITTYVSNNQSYIVGLGRGSRNTNRVTSNTDACANHHGLGINPSAGDHDTDGNAVPAIFSTYNSNLGVGGQIVTNDAPAAGGFGAGGSFTVSDTDLTFSNVQAGKDGAAILRWKQTELGNTGSNSGELSALAASLIALGATLMVGSRARRRVQK